MQTYSDYVCCGGCLLQKASLVVGGSSVRLTCLTDSNPFECWTAGFRSKDFITFNIKRIDETMIDSKLLSSDCDCDWDWGRGLRMGIGMGWGWEIGHGNGNREYPYSQSQEMTVSV